MSFRTSLRSMFLIAALFVCAGIASAQADLGPQRGTGSSSSQLNLSANAQTALQLDISTATGGATVTGATGRTSTGVFSLSFGNVNGLGLGTLPTGVSVDVQASGALYTTPVTLTPKFSGHGNSTASVFVYLDGTAGTAAGRTATREGASAATVATVPGSLTPGTVTTTGAHNTAITRYVGMFVSSANGATAVNGALDSRIIYQVTVP